MKLLIMVGVVILAVVAFALSLAWASGTDAGVCEKTGRGRTGPGTNDDKP